jgi:ribosomal protein S18 acetylase RimI-like enzyme
MGGGEVEIIKAASKELPGLLEVNATLVDSTVDHTDFIKKSVKAGKCFAALVSGKVAGFGILGTSLFYEQQFIELLAVHPQYKRRGIATALIRRMEEICPAKKLFTSTNKSNIIAQKTYEANGFIRSGYIENLDEGDPEIIYFKLLAATDKGGKL